MILLYWCDPTGGEYQKVPWVKKASTYESSQHILKEWAGVLGLNISDKNVWATACLPPFPVPPTMRRVDIKISNLQEDSAFLWHKAGSVE